MSLIACSQKSLFTVLEDLCRLLKNCVRSWVLQNAPPDLLFRSASRLCAAHAKVLETNIIYTSRVAVQSFQDVKANYSNQLRENMLFIMLCRTVQVDVVIVEGSTLSAWGSQSPSTYSQAHLTSVHGYHLKEHCGDFHRDESDET